MSIRDVLVCEFERHFDKDKKLIRDIKASEKLHLGSYCETINLAESSIAHQYGLIAGEYIEIIINAIERTTYVTKYFREKEVKKI